MIRNLIVNINSDRSVFPKELKVANRYEIKTNVLNIKFSFDLPENSFVYLVLTRNQIQYYYPLINNLFSFDSNETWINGGWIGYVLISKAEIIDGVVNSSEALFISDAFGLTVGDSEFNIEKLEQQELPAQLHLLYDDLLHLKAELEELIRNGDFSDLSITVDSALSKTSENPVQNKVITSEINKLKESIANQTLGIASDGMIYLFVDGKPQGTGIPRSSGTVADVYGYVDENKVVVLEGDLPDDTYSFAFKLKDGTLVDMCNFTVDNEEDVIEPTNLFVVGGDGYVLNGRCSSAGADRTDSNGCIVTNYIKVSNGDTVYLNKEVVSTTNAYSGMKLTDGSVKGFLPTNESYITNLSTSNGITQFTVSNADADYIRICIDINFGTAITNDDVTNAGVIITVNEPLS